MSGTATHGSLQLTPWARAAIDTDTQQALRNRVPANHELSIGGGKRGRWAAYLIHPNAGVVARAQQQPTWEAAVALVLPTEVAP
jgi:hypothetical protein